MLTINHSGTGGAGGMADHAARARLVTDQAAPALLVAAVRTLAMVAAGAVPAVAVYRWLGLKAVSRTWSNVDAVWALGLVLVGVLSAYAAW